MKKLRIPVFFILIFFCLAVFVSCRADVLAAPEPAPVPQTALPLPTETIPGFMLLPGVYTAGANIEEGEYVLLATSGAKGYFELTFGGELFDGNFQRQHIILYDGDSLFFSDSVLLRTQNAPVRTDIDGGIFPGMYKAGGDIPAGEYVIVDETFGYDYLEIKDLPLAQPHHMEFVGNAIFTHRQCFRLDAGQYVDFAAGKMYPVAAAPLALNADGSYPIGQYLVGVHIPEGNYTFVPVDVSAYFVTKNPMCDLDYLMTGITAEPVRIFLTAGQYITLRGGSLFPTPVA